MKKLAFIASLVALLAVVMVAQPVEAKSTFATGQAPITQEVTAAPEITATFTVPFLNEWLSSGHADFSAEAFNRWNDEDPAQVPANCAKCHSEAGYLDYLGADGSAVHVVDSPAPIGSVVSCATCHNDATLSKTSVIMPSGIELTGLGDEARCMECHQGRESMVSVNNAIDAAGVEDDAVSPDLRFRNIHYYAAAATKYGTLAKGGYEYAGMTYDANFAHVEGFDTCIGCHNSHTLEVKVEQCSECHTGVETVEDLRDVRMEGSIVDYDGDGDLEEGIAYEIEGLQAILYEALQGYAAEVVETGIVYDADAYPYFFIDTNANGEADDDEIVAPNGFNAWSPRLLKAAYNYQTSKKDPGAFAHGGKYIIQLLHDSIADLNSAVAEPTDMAEMRRIDAGHFAGSEQAFRYWDGAGTVPATCSKCHTGAGLPLFLAEKVTMSQAPSNGLQCSTCHNDLVEYTRYEVEAVTFPSGAVLSMEDPDDNLCLQCHQGRESTVSVNRLIGDTEADTVSDALRFLNIHYFAAGATRFGTEAKGAYEYEGMEYVGFFDHSNVNSCADCHGAHKLEVDPQICAECHEEVTSKEDLVDIRYNYADYDGDGDDREGLALELETMREILYAALQEYAADTVGTDIVYTSASHPYFFIDTNGNGEADPDEISGTNRYNTWTPRLLRAAYNYQYASKDPGAFAHNGQYIVQVLYDSIEDLGGDVSDMERP
jgi:hypothetical protein